MKLYWAPQTRAFTALWMLEESGLPYQRVLMDWRAGALATDSYRAINPMMKVPALEDGPVKMAETGAICAYIAERAPKAGLAPPLGDPRRGRYWQWLFFGGNCIEPAVAQFFAKFEMTPGSAAWGDSQRVFSVLEQALIPGPWLLGDDFCAADVVVGAYVDIMVHRMNVLPAKPAFTAYIESCRARPAHQRASAINQAG
jgi:glutathione S-transferase